jgi:DNA replication protein DnaC
VASNGHGDVTRLFPGATKAVCENNYGSGSVRITKTDGHETYTHCPLCKADKLATAVAAFTPPRFRAPIDIPDEVAEWADRGDQAQGLYLAGQVGTGKTHTAWAALTRWCAVTGTRPYTPRDTGIEGWSTAGPTVIFTRMTDLLDDLRPGDGSRQRIRDCQRAHLLVIDDFGAEKSSEWTQERFYSIVDHRYANCLPLIVTSNLPPGEVVEQGGDRAASRLAEMCAVVKMTGDDRRRPAA